MAEVDFKHETFAKPHKTGNFVIPAKAGIQYYQIFSSFPRIKYEAGSIRPGMTNKEVIQRSKYLYLNIRLDIVSGFDQGDDLILDVYRRWLLQKWTEKVTLMSLA